VNILGLDNSTSHLSIAVKKDQKIFEVNTLVPRGSDHIIPQIKKILTKANLTPDKLDCLAVGLGPGSFTGLRVSLSIIKGFSLALKKPVVTASSFLAIAREHAPEGKTLAVILDARKDLVYAGLYKRKGSKVTVLKAVRLTTLDRFLKDFCNKDCLFAGESVQFKERIHTLYPAASLKESVTFPKARFLFTKAEEDFKKRRWIKRKDLTPLYLHPETCQIRKKKR
jgi:tRNA threonylcarbamoyladenosine biosynthesis protein TsaB